VSRKWAKWPVILKAWAYFLYIIAIKYFVFISVGVVMAVNPVSAEISLLRSWNRSQAVELMNHPHRPAPAHPSFSRKGGGR
jgi:hypothetical protein